MNAEEQEQLAQRVEQAFHRAGIVVEQPAPKELGGGFKFESVEGASWLTLVSWLTRSGYRLTITDTVLLDVVEESDD